MLKEGSYACYWNRIYLVGQFGVGKTTLAKNPNYHTNTAKTAPEKNPYLI
jgi:GTPase SAR1 family protein